MTVTKDGMRVGMKEMGGEGERDRTQSVLVKAWNLSLWGNGSGEKAQKAGAGADGRKGGRSEGKKGR